MIEISALKSYYHENEIIAEVLFEQKIVVGKYLEVAKNLIS